MLGPQGSGKGTQGEMLSNRLGIPTISMGELLREEKRKDSPMAGMLREHMDKGEMVPDAITNELMRQRLADEDCRKGWILDGYPRRAAQAEFLKEISPPDVVIVLEIPDELAIERISSRRICKAHGHVYGLHRQPKEEGTCDIDGSELYQREDDRPEAIRKRLEIYHSATEDMIRTFENVERIDGTGSPEEVFETILKVLQKSA